MKKTTCLACGSPCGWPEAFCTEDCRRNGARPAAAPYSMPTTIMRSAPPKTLSVREADALARTAGLRTPDATARLHEAQEEDMMIRAALRTRQKEAPLERRSNSGVAMTKTEARNYEQWCQVLGVKP